MNNSNSFWLAFHCGLFLGLAEALFVFLKNRSLLPSELALLILYVTAFYALIPAVIGLLIFRDGRSISVPLFFFFSAQFVSLLWLRSAGSAVTIGLISILAGIAAAILAGLAIAKIFLLTKTRTWFLLNTILVLLLISLKMLGYEKQAGPRATGKPNILLISIDTLRADRVGSYGYTGARTPHIDRLASEGILFQQAVAPVPLTGPSHISMLTGLYPSAHGALLNGIPLRKEVTILPELLSQNGYETAAFVSGFTMKNSATALAGRFHYYSENFGSRWLPDVIWELDLPRITARLLFILTGTQLERLERNAMETSADALSWLDRRDPQKPFFIFVHYFDPHAPYAPPPSFAAGSDATPEARYDSEIAFTDQSIGELLEGLEALAKNTVIILTSDHGESLTEHGYSYDHGEYVYDTCMRVPLIVRFPDRRFAGIKRMDQVGLIDIAPTISELSGIRVDQRMDGTSLLPLVEKGETHRPHIFGYIRYGEGTVQRYFLRKHGWKLIWNFDQRDLPAYEELYDLQSDPGEARNMIPLTPPVLGSLQNELSKWVRTQRDTHSHAPEEQLRERLRSLGYL